MKSPVTAALALALALGGLPQPAQAESVWTDCNQHGIRKGQNGYVLSIGRSGDVHWTVPSGNRTTGYWTPARTRDEVLVHLKGEVLVVNVSCPNGTTRF